MVYQKKMAHQENEALRKKVAQETGGERSSAAREWAWINNNAKRGHKNPIETIRTRKGTKVV